MARLDLTGATKSVMPGGGRLRSPDQAAEKDVMPVEWALTPLDPTPFRCASGAAPLHRWFRVGRMLCGGSVGPDRP